MTVPTVASVVADHRLARLLPGLHAAGEVVDGHTAAASRPAATPGSLAGPAHSDNRNGGVMILRIEDPRRTWTAPGRARRPFVVLADVEQDGAGDLYEPQRPGRIDPGLCISAPFARMADSISSAGISLVQKNQSSQCSPGVRPDIRSAAVPQEPAGHDHRVAGSPVRGVATSEMISGLRCLDDAQQLVEVAAEAQRIVNDRADNAFWIDDEDPRVPPWWSPRRA